MNNENTTARPLQLVDNEYGLTILDAEGNPVVLNCGNKDFVREIVTVFNTAEAKDKRIDELEVGLEEAVELFISGDLLLNNLKELLANKGASENG